MKLHEAAQQALEAMEKNTKHLPLHFDNYFEAMYALRAALAEPVQDWEAVAADQALTIALMKTEQQEPMAWMVYTLNGKSVCITDNPSDFTDTHRALPLYTAPPQRKPLTEEEIRRIYETHRASVPLYHAIARAIERAHGIEVQI